MPAFSESTVGEIIEAMVGDMASGVVKDSLKGVIKALFSEAGEPWRHRAGIMALGTPSNDEQLFWVSVARASEKLESKKLTLHKYITAIGRLPASKRNLYEENTIQTWIMDLKKSGGFKDLDLKATLELVIEQTANVIINHAALIDDPEAWEALTKIQQINEPLVRRNFQRENGELRHEINQLRLKRAELWWNPIINWLLKGIHTEEEARRLAQNEIRSNELETNALTQFAEYIENKELQIQKRLEQGLIVLSRYTGFLFYAGLLFVLVLLIGILLGPFGRTLSLVLVSIEILIAAVILMGILPGLAATEEVQELPVIRKYFKGEGVKAFLDTRNVGIFLAILALPLLIPILLDMPASGRNYFKPFVELYYIALPFTGLPFKHEAKPKKG